MVTLDEMRRAALRYDTQPAHAMRRALGIERPGGACRRRGSGRHAERERYRGVGWCFRNLDVPGGSRAL